MPKLTDQNLDKKNNQILDFIAANNGATIREIAGKMNISTQNCYRYLVPMAEAGLIFKGIRKEPGITKDDVETIAYYSEP
jgi:predicted transcriptional regulator